MSKETKTHEKASHQGSRYQIRKDGRIYAAWDDPSCGYDRDTLRSMKEAGYRLYVDGRLQR